MGATGAKRTAVVALVAAMLVVMLAVAAAKPTIYAKNDNDKLEPVLVPVSSTVIPLPVYKVGFSLGAAKGSDRERERGAANGKPEEPIKLITVHNNKKKASSTITIKNKPL